MFAARLAVGRRTHTRRAPSARGGVGRNKPYSDTPPSAARRAVGQEHTGMDHCADTVQVARCQSRSGMLCSWTSPQSCIHCDTVLADASDFPAEAVTALDALPKRGQRFGPGDVVAWLCGPVPPTFTSPNVWVHAPASFDASAAFVDEFFASRAPTVRGHLIDQFANAPFVSDTANCRTGPVCTHGETTRCVCD